MDWAIYLPLIHASLATLYASSQHLGQSFVSPYRVKVLFLFTWCLSYLLYLGHFIWAKNCGPYLLGHLGLMGSILLLDLDSNPKKSEPINKTKLSIAIKLPLLAIFAAVTFSEWWSDPVVNQLVEFMVLSVLALLVFPYRHQLRLAYRSLIMMCLSCFFLVFLADLDLFLAKEIGRIVLSFFYYQFLNYFLVKNYFAAKIEAL